MHHAPQSPQPQTAANQCHGQGKSQLQHRPPQPATPLEPLHTPTTPAAAWLFETCEDRCAAHVPISAADACGSCTPAQGRPLQPPEIIRGAKAFMAAEAAARHVAVEDVCWWFQSGYEVAEGGDRLAWSTSFVTSACSAAFSTFFMLNVLECAFITAARATADDPAATGAPFMHHAPPPGHAAPQRAVLCRAVCMAAGRCQCECCYSH